MRIGPLVGAGDFDHQAAIETPSHERVEIAQVLRRRAGDIGFRKVVGAEFALDEVRLHPQQGHVGSARGALLFRPIVVPTGGEEIGEGQVSRPLMLSNKNVSRLTIPNRRLRCIRLRWRRGGVGRRRTVVRSSPDYYKCGEGRDQQKTGCLPCIFQHGGVLFVRRRSAGGNRGKLARILRSKRFSRCGSPWPRSWQPILPI